MFFTISPPSGRVTSTEKARTNAEYSTTGLVLHRLRHWEHWSMAWQYIVRQAGNLASVRPLFFSVYGKLSKLVFVSFVQKEITGKGDCSFLRHVSNKKCDILQHEFF